MSKKTPTDALILGAEPRADLLPVEVHGQIKARGTRRLLLYVLVGVLVITVAGIAAAAYSAGDAQRQLAAEQAHTQDLLAMQSKYVKVRSVQADVAAAQAAQQVGASTEIDWKPYLDKVQATLPSGSTLTVVTIDSESPLLPYGQAAAPLQPTRIATLTLTVASPTLPDVVAWLEALHTLPGFADAVPGATTQIPNGYTVNVTMHINEEAFSKRFAEIAK
ncbi:hypothetical protein [Leifsonia sp. Root112D2]|jgi:hypothetical protein|uniref:hypothetical protein n=1 Tax=Leifsonia sp. Root112D2 TaxID=1736426 RepID=UPI0006FA64A3|nr:hypothetical protein [Leifsonia sp. Root112D2]KQV07154.1 hypothetical protein ASC63_07500 [Leifsonia sp. Root112D2]